MLKVDAAGRGSIVIDGEEATNCRGVVVKASVGQPTTITLELVNVSVEVDAAAEVDA